MDALTCWCARRRRLPRLLLCLPRLLLLHLLLLLRRGQHRRLVKEEVLPTQLLLPYARHESQFPAVTVAVAAKAVEANPKSPSTVEACPIPPFYS